MSTREHTCNPDKQKYVYYYEVIGKSSLDFDGDKWYICPDDYKIEIIFCPYCGESLP